jgi:hypothetical protein
MIRITTPDHAGSREQAQDLVRSLADDLTGQTVLVDCSRLVVGTPSFLDELVKQILEQRNAQELEVSGGPQRARALLERSAENRGVRSRVRTAVALG